MRINRKGNFLATLFCVSACLLAEPAAMASSPMEAALMGKTPAKPQSATAAAAATLAGSPGLGPAKKDAPVFSTTRMAGAGKMVPAELTLQGHTCNISIPGDYFLSEFAPPIGKLFSFQGPQHPDKTRAIFNITIIPSPDGAPIPSEREMLDVMLNPYRKSLLNYTEGKEPLFMSGTHSFKGMHFAGADAEKHSVKGFVYLTQSRDTFFVLFAQDEVSFADKSLPILLKSTKACQLK